MNRRIPLVVALCAACCSFAPRSASGSELITEPTAARHGLTRPWFAQVELDRSYARVTSVILREGVLYAQTDTAILHAIDAETGKTIWSRRVGRPEHPSMTPDARGALVAVVNGSRLYLIDRFNGNALYEEEIEEAPGAGPALSSERVYVPMVSGMVVAYPLSLVEEPKRRAAREAENEDRDAKEGEESAAELESKKSEPPLFCRSIGRALVQPLVTRDDPGGEYVVWPTDRGFLNFGRIDREIINAFVIKFRLETEAPISSQPGYLPPDPKVLGDSGVVYAASGDGFVYAVKEEDGDTLWRFSTGEPIIRAPAVIDDRVYVVNQLGGMYCLESKTGRELWWTPRATRFIAAGKNRVYAADRVGRILVIDAAAGALIDVIPTENVSIFFHNTQTDRVYLIGRKGLIQCLHAAGQVEPILHNKYRREEAEPGVNPFAEKPADENQAPDAGKDDADNPFL